MTMGLRLDRRQRRRMKRILRKSRKPDRGVPRPRPAAAPRRPRPTAPRRRPFRPRPGVDYRIPHRLRLHGHVRVRAVRRRSRQSLMADHRARVTRPLLARPGALAEWQASAAHGGAATHAPAHKRHAYEHDGRDQRHCNAPPPHGHHGNPPSLRGSRLLPGRTWSPPRPAPHSRAALTGNRAPSSRQSARAA